MCHHLCILLYHHWDGQIGVSLSAFPHVLVYCYLCFHVSPPVLPDVSSSVSLLVLPNVFLSMFPYLILISMHCNYLIGLCKSVEIVRCWSRLHFMLKFIGWHKENTAQVQAAVFNEQTCPLPSYCVTVAELHIPNNELRMFGSTGGD